MSSESPAVARRSLRLSQPPPDAMPQPAPPKPTPSRGRAPKPKPGPSRRRAPKPKLAPFKRRAPKPKPTPSKLRVGPIPPPPKPRSTTFCSSLASTILEAVSLSPGAAKLRADDFDAGKELVLAPANVRTLLPSRILGLLVLPLVDRTMVAAGNNLGSIGFWHADGADEVFEYLPHRGPVAAIVAHPALPQKAIFCLDDTVRVFEGDGFDSSHIIKHNNQTGPWISTFKAIWGWNDSDLFVGNMKRAVDVFSVGSSSDGGLLLASNTACLENEHMTTIPCRFSAHPYKVGHLAFANSGGVFLWTRA